MGLTNRDEGEGQAHHFLIDQVWPCHVLWCLCIRICILNCMQTTSVRIDRATHLELKRLASELEVSVGEAVRIAVRRATQERIGAQLAAELASEDNAWLDADLG